MEETFSQVEVTFSEVGQASHTGPQTGGRCAVHFAGMHTLSLLRRDSSSQTARWVQVIVASFFGVGAPEALLVAVVSLIVFGPKGLAEARLDSCLLY